MRKFLKLGQLFKSTKGVAAIEFAILLPFLIIVLFGVYQVTTFITAVRKVDNVTNDIGYILSREGCITPLDADGNCTTTGGKERLESIFDNTIPFLIYPYKYSSTDGTSQIKVKFVGLPDFSGCTDATTNKDTVRVMWEHVYPLTSTGDAQVSPDNDTVSQCGGTIAANCPDACPASPGTKYNSFYSDGAGGSTSRANIIYPGQSFILVNFAFNFRALLGENLIGVAMPKNIEKLSSYAARSSLRQIAGVVKVLNDMQYCTNCNAYNSTYNGGGNSMHQGGSPFRQICTNVASINPSNSNAGGCLF